MKVVFCMPGASYSRDFLLCWSDMLMQANAKGHQIMISQQYSSVVHFARALCLGGDVMKGPDQKPFQGGVEYDVMVWIDSDVIFKADDLFRLLESPHDITSGLYMMENLQTFATVQTWNDEYYIKNGSFEFMKPSDIKGASQYVPVAYTGMGWMAIRSGVVETLKYPWFWSPLQTIGPLVDMNSEDVSFCRSLTDAGHVIYVDTTIRVGHQKKMII